MIMCFSCMRFTFFRTTLFTMRPISSYYLSQTKVEDQLKQQRLLMQQKRVLEAHQRKEAETVVLRTGNTTPKTPVHSLLFHIVLCQKLIFCRHI